MIQGSKRLYFLFKVFRLSKEFVRRTRKHEHELVTNFIAVKQVYLILIVFHQLSLQYLQLSYLVALLGQIWNNGVHSPVYDLLNNFLEGARIIGWEHITHQILNTRLDIIYWGDFSS
jgi:hypothetical protein